MIIDVEQVAWTVCCDFHDKPEEIKAHLGRWSQEYGKDSTGKQICAPKGYVLLPFRARIPNGKHAYYNAEIKQWLFRDCISTMTPIFTEPHLLYVRAYAVPEQ